MPTNNENLIKLLEEEILKETQKRDFYKENKIDALADVQQEKIEKLQAELAEAREAQKKEVQQTPESLKVEDPDQLNLDDFKPTVRTRARLADREVRIPQVKGAQPPNSPPSKQPAIAEPPKVPVAPEPQPEDPVPEMLAEMKGAQAIGDKLIASAEAQANEIKSKQENSPQAARVMTAGYLDSIDTLEGYKTTLKDPLQKGGIFQSNQVAKGEIANRIINKMEQVDPSDLTQMQDLKSNLEQAIKDNLKATGVRLWNKGGNLDKHLNATLDLVESHIKILENLQAPIKGKSPSQGA